MPNDFILFTKIVCVFKSLLLKKVSFGFLVTDHFPIVISRRVNKFHFKILIILYLSSPLLLIFLILVLTRFLSFFPGSPTHSNLFNKGSVMGSWPPNNDRKSFGLITSLRKWISSPQCKIVGTFVIPSLMMSWNHNIQPHDFLPDLDMLPGSILQQPEKLIWFPLHYIWVC